MSWPFEFFDSIYLSKLSSLSFFNPPLTPKLSQKIVKPTTIAMAQRFVGVCSLAALPNIQAVMSNHSLGTQPGFASLTLLSTNTCLAGSTPNARFHIMGMISNLGKLTSPSCVENSPYG